MKKFLVRTVLSLFILLAASVSLSPPAEAISISFRNPFPHKLWAAVVYLEDSSRKWVVKGWYGVEPRSSRTININESTKGKHVYIHAWTSEATFGGNQYSLKYTVIAEAFQFYAGQPAPAGTKRSQVHFDRWFVENDGSVKWRP